TMAGVDQALQPFRAAVGVVRRVKIDAVVSPAAIAGKLCHRHQLDDGHAKFAQVIEPGGCASEGSLRRESPDWQLVDETWGQFDSAPAGVRPGEGGVIERSRPAV